MCGGAVLGWLGSRNDNDDSLIAGGGGNDGEGACLLVATALRGFKIVDFSRGDTKAWAGELEIEVQVTWVLLRWCGSLSCVGMEAEDA